MICHPFDCLSETVFESDARSPTEDFVGFFGGTEKAFDFGIFWSDSLGIGDNFDRFVHEFGDQMSEVADADFAVAAEVDGLADGGGGFGSGKKTFDGVADKVEVAGWGEGSEFDGFTFVELADDSWDDGASGLAGAECVERADCHDRDIEAEVKALGDFIGSDF